MIGLDLGTTSCKAVVIDAAGRARDGRPRDARCRRGCDPCELDVAHAPRHDRKHG